MDIKTVLFILSISTHSTLSQLSKCSDAPPQACGRNANCYDNQTDPNYIKLNGPYCKCTDDAYGSPPNCRPRCSYDSDCKTNEFCDFSGSKECIEGCRKHGCKFGEHCDSETRKCTNGCKMDFNCDFDESCNQNSQKCLKICAENVCGPNGKCKAMHHTKYCSCVDGFIPDKAVKGCRPQNYTDEKPNCKSACGSENRCSEIDGSTYCFCPLPFIPSFHPCPHFSAAPFPPGESPAYKPTTENEIFSLQTVIVLSG
ncbi:adhesive plaque matrix protein 2-like [Chironomus tepperi]|uniref:adhesive plaque matrix protein 2-like n=1 Tax=Chironomus tepperi TaxID=113505 RepID=UPI00391EE43C